jgi:hypothetical protein
MSTTYTAYTVIGVRLHENQLVRYRKVKGCNCFDVDPRNKFCPHCAAPVSKSHKYYVGVFNGERDQLERELDNGLKLVRPYHDSEDVFLGSVFGVDHDVGSGDFTWNFLHWPDMEFVMSTKEKLRHMLELHELWDERDFGIYTFLGIR